MILRGKNMQYNRAKNNLILTFGFNEEEERNLHDIFADSYTLHRIDTKLYSKLTEIVDSLVSSALFLLVRYNERTSVLHSTKLLEECMSRLPVFLVHDKDILNKDENAKKNPVLQAKVAYPIHGKHIASLLRIAYERAKILSIKKDKRLEQTLIHDLYEQKDRALKFILPTMQELDRAKNIQDLFDSARLAFESLFPLQSMHIAFLEKEKGRMVYLLGINGSYSDLSMHWKERMDAHLQKLVNSLIVENKKILCNTNEKLDVLGKSSSYSLLNYYKENNSFSHKIESMGTYALTNPSPEKGGHIALPLSINSECVGIIVLQLMPEKDFYVDYGKDMSTSINLVCSHLACLLDNIIHKMTSSEMNMAQNKAYSALNSLAGMQITQ